MKKRDETGFVCTCYGEWHQACENSKCSLNKECNAVTNAGDAVAITEERDPNTKKDLFDWNTKGTGGWVPKDAVIITQEHDPNRFQCFGVGSQRCRDEGQGRWKESRAREEGCEYPTQCLETWGHTIGGTIEDIVVILKESP